MNIIALVNRNVALSEERIQHLLWNSPKLKRLYYGIQKRGITSESSAIAHIYCGQNNGRRNLKELVRRLENRILNLVLFIDTGPNLKLSIEKASVSASRRYLIAKILINFGDTQVAPQILEGVLKKSIRYELTELTVLSAKLLLGVYSAMMEGNEKTHSCINLIERYSHILEAESKAEVAYFTVVAKHTNSQRPLSKHELDEIAQSTATVLKKFRGVSSRRFIRVLYMYKCTLAELRGNPQEQQKLCLEAKQLLQERPYKLKSVYDSFNIRLLSSYIKLGNYSKAKSLVSSVTPTIRQEDSFLIHWSIYHFLLLCHSEEYQEAQELIVELKILLRKHKVNRGLWEVSLVYEAYVNFFAKVGLIENVKKGDFRLYRFLNDVPVYSKDKRGINISILILHLGFLLTDRKYSKAHDRIQALLGYSRKYLYHDESFRSNCFIKMLGQLARAEFNAIRGQRYAKPLLQKLRQVPLSQSKQTLEIEILPYERMWDIFLKLCDFR